MMCVMSSGRSRSAGRRMLVTHRAVEEVLAEAPRGHFATQLAIGGGDDAHAHLPLAGIAHAHHDAVLQHAQQVGCMSSGSSPTSSRNSVPPSATELARQAMTAGAGEGTFHIAEEFAGEQFARQAPQLMATKGHRVCAGAVNGTGEELLADPGFTEQHDRKIERAGARTGLGRKQRFWSCRRSRRRGRLRGRWHAVVIRARLRWRVILPAACCSGMTTMLPKRPSAEPMIRTHSLRSRRGARIARSSAVSSRSSASTRSSLVNGSWTPCCSRAACRRPLPRAAGRGGRRASRNRCRSAKPSMEFSSRRA